VKEHNVSRTARLLTRSTHSQHIYLLLTSSNVQ